MNIGTRILAALASLKLTVFGLFLLLILTVWGTLYQAEFGLYQAQARFYQTWYFLVGGVVPFPGAQLVMSLLFVNLLAAILWLAVRRRLHPGMVITHAGLLLMLAAGGVTFYLGNESLLTLLEGEGSNVATSDQHWELALWRADTTTVRDVQALDAGQLRPGQTLTLPGDAGTLTVESYAPHAALQSSPDGQPALAPLPFPTEPSQARPGLVALLALPGAAPERLVLWGGHAERLPTRLTLAGQPHWLSLRQRRTRLPVLVTLIDFKREFYPGSEIARRYSSLVRIGGEGQVERTVTISMNRPLRIAGFTFYQASYHDLQDGREASTLSVVKNYGRTLPYVATGVTGLGMILHFMGILLLRVRRKPAGAGGPS